jgi:hypothetical protein
MRYVVRLLLISIVAAGVFGCSAKDVATADVIPSGTLLKVTLIDGINSDTSSDGDTFLASLAESVVIRGTTVLAIGTIVSGLVIDSAGSDLAKGNARIRFTLTGVTQGDHTVSITTNTFSATSTATGKHDLEIVAGGSGQGEEAGETGRLFTGDNGAGFGFAAEGKEIHYGPETRLNFTLKKPVQFQIHSGSSPDKLTAVSN